MALPARIGLVFAVSLLLSACSGIPVEEGSPDSGSAEPPPPCGNLDRACSESEYCRVSSVLKSDGESLILTSDCEPLPSPACPVTGTLDALCACLSADAVARGGNCALFGTVFSCEVQGRSGVTSPRLALTCIVTL